MFSKLLTLTLLASTLSSYSAFSSEGTSDAERKALTVSKVRVVLVEKDVLNNEMKTVVDEKMLDLPGMPLDGTVGPEDKVGKIIAIGKDLVAFGESLYALVIKGKPSNKTTYAPISVVPKINGEPADIFDTEGWKAPKKFTYEVIATNGFGIDTITFRYSVIYSYGGSVDGKGSYITAAQIVPVSVNTLFGYDFSATMKLGGLQNHGTKANPMAGVILIMEYQISTVFQNSIDTASFHIMGNGAFKKI